MQTGTRVHKRTDPVSVLLLGFGPLLGCYGCDVLLGYVVTLGRTGNCYTLFDGLFIMISIGTQSWGLISLSLLQLAFLVAWVPNLNPTTYSAVT
jgi:hypothetical protein